jgi:hypothetical protein
MAPRLQLQSLLETIAEHVYFQPPSNLKMEYPCVVYHRDFAETEHADNGPYRHTQRYLLTVIDRNPDSLIPAKVALLPMCSYNRFFIADNLNHDVYTIFF